MPTWMKEAPLPGAPVVWLTPTHFPSDQRPGLLEVFAGCTSLSAAAAEAGRRVLHPIDIEYDAQCDVLDRGVLHAILGVVRSGTVRWVHLATPCTSFCRFFVIFNRRYSCTTHLPEGLGTFDREIEGNKFVAASCRIIDAAM